MLNAEYVARCEDWLGEQFEALTDELEFRTPSEYVEEKRYLPPQVTPMPGYYSFDVAPYLREIADCADPHSPVNEVDFMKGVQICATVGILENIICYLIGYIKNAPAMLLTADSDLAKLRMESYITPMINYSGLDELIQSSDEKNTRKTGKTDKKIEWAGGGFLVPTGAQNPNKLRSLSIQYMLEDEIDGYPDTIGKGEDPCATAEDRTAAYESSRKIFRITTPLISQTSKILPHYEKGDQRKYMVPCKHCGRKQELVFQGVDTDTGATYGIEFERDDGVLIEESVRYVCKYCHGAHTNDDKAWMYRDGGAHCEWVPTSRPTSPNRRSYHISALYSPVGMQTWTTQVKKWLDCWDADANRVKDMEKFQLFYNNVLGKPFEMRGQALKFERVVTHRRIGYHSGEVPNAMAEKETGGKIQLLTCAVDVHKAHLDVQVVGWAPRARFYSIEWVKFEGDCEDLAAEPWEQLRELIETRVYIADDKRQYRPQITLIDTQYNADLVLRFCAEYSAGVFPISGRDLPPKAARIKEFSEYISKLGTVAYNVTVTIYKDRLSSALRREWDGESLQPDGHPNFPQDYPDRFFKEFTVEHKKEKIDPRTGQRLGFVWVKPSGAANHAWDLAVYNLAALDMVAYDICMRELELEHVDWAKFWEVCETDAIFWE